MAFDKKVFSARLRGKRAELDLTQEALAERSGVSTAAVVQYEADDGYVPGADKLWRIADALGCDPAWLMGWDVRSEAACTR